MNEYPAYKASDVDWLGDIPQEWDAKRVKFLFEIRKRIVGEEGHAVLSITQQGIKEKDTESGEGQLSMDYSKYQIVEVGDFAMNHMDLLTGFVDISKFEGVTSPDYRVFSLINSNSYARYFLYLFQLCYINKIFFGLGQGSAQLGRWRLPSFQFKNFSIPVPSLSEQQAIANFLDRKTAQIDDLIAKKQRQIDLLHEQRTALINQAVTKGLNPDVPMKDSGMEWLGEIPNHWVMTTVRYFYDVKLGKMLNSNKQNGNGLVKPYLRAANIHWNKILLDGVGVNEMEFSKPQLERYVLQSGDLLVTEGGVTVGRSAIWNGELAECYYQNSLNRARPINNISTKWLYYWMYFVTNNGFIDILADKSTFGHLTNEKLKALPIPIPPVTEHDEIIEKLESYEPKMEAQVTMIKRQIAFLQEYRTALISAAVTGKIDVREDGTIHE